MERTKLTRSHRLIEIKVTIAVSTAVDARHFLQKTAEQVVTSAWEALDRDL